VPWQKPKKSKRFRRKCGDGPVEPNQDKRLRLALQNGLHQMADRSPIYGAILTDWLNRPIPALTVIVDQYCRILSTAAPDLTLLLAGLHHLALSGNAPRWAQHCASCGGEFHPNATGAMTTAVDAELSAAGDDLLDFMLSQETRREPIETAPMLLLGSLTSVAEFGGSIALVEYGCGGGSRMLFDQYQYQFGPHLAESSPDAATEDSCRFILELEGAKESIGLLLANGMPQVISRRGLATERVDLTDPDHLRLYEAFLPPDDLRAHGLLRSAAAKLGGHDGLAIDLGDPAADLLPLLAEVYEAMPPGNTLLLADLLQWGGLRSEDRQRVTYQVQSFVARLQPHKPVAWLQVDRLNPAMPTIETRLQLFGWSDPEDRSVRRIAEASPNLTRLRWLG